MIKFVANKIKVKAEANNANAGNDTFLGQHAVNGKTYVGPRNDFNKQPELFSNTVGPFHNDSHAGAYFHATGPHAEPTLKPPADLGFKAHQESGKFIAPPDVMSNYANAKNSALPGKFDYPKPRSTQSLTFDHGPVVNNIHRDIAKAGGKTRLVGGAVRDFLMDPDAKPKDKDYEVYGLPAESLNKILSRHGHLNEVGASFGVSKLKTPDGEDLDFALPRRDSKMGDGHKGINASSDPFMSEKEAAGRRDYTINGLMMDENGKIHDHYGGLDDLKNKKLRHINEQFTEDPLRVLRGMQMAGRFGMDMDPETAKLSQSISDQHQHLTKDRIMTEFQKLAEKGTQPSKAFKVLKDSGWDEHYPELAQAIRNPAKMQEMDNMSRKLQSENFSPEDKNALFFALLTHDMSPESAVSLLNRIGMPQGVQKRILALQKGMNSSHFKDGEPTPQNIRNTSAHVFPETINNLMHLQEAKNGKLNANHQSFHDTAKSLGVNESKPQPFVNGNVLKDLGIKPGPDMGRLLNEVYQQQLDGRVNNSEEARKWLQGRLGSV